MSTFLMFINNYYKFLIFIGTTSLSQLSASRSLNPSLTAHVPCTHYLCSPMLLEGDFLRYDGVDTCLNSVPLLFFLRANVLLPAHYRLTFRL
jgi:hypothetical protein